MKFSAVLYSLEYLKINAYVNREHICQKFGFSKTTYYRALKWLEHRKN